MKMYLVALISFLSIVDGSASNCADSVAKGRFGSSVLSRGIITAQFNPVIVGQYGELSMASMEISMQGWRAKLTPGSTPQLHHTLKADIASLLCYVVQEIEREQSKIVGSSRPSQKLVDVVYDAAQEWKATQRR